MLKRFLLFILLLGGSQCDDVGTDVEPELDVAGNWLGFSIEPGFDQDGNEVSFQWEWELFVDMTPDSVFRVTHYRFLDQFDSIVPPVVIGENRRFAFSYNTINRSIEMTGFFLPDGQRLACEYFLKDNRISSFDGNEFREGEIFLQKQ